MLDVASKDWFENDHIYNIFSFVYPLILLAVYSVILNATGITVLNGKSTLE